MTETTNLQQDNQDMQRDNYGLVETHQRPETDKDTRECCCCCRCCRCCCLKFLGFWIGCWEFCVRFLRKYCCLICCYRCCCWPCCSCCHCCHCCRCSQGNVQIYIPEQTRSITGTGFSSAISNVCKDIAYTCQLCDNVGILKEELPLVVVCQNSTRYESDIDEALSEIKWKSPFVVLLLHCGLESSLPIIPTADKLANEKKYQQVKFIDVAYNSDSKLYQCEMNRTARRQLKTCLKYLKHNNSERNMSTSLNKD